MPTFEPDLISPHQKTKENSLPFLSFPITTQCLFRCVYCGEGGEATASYESIASHEFVVERTSIGYEYGIRKFRLTGGEPTTHPDFERMVEFILSLPEVYLLINTNGALIREKSAWVTNLNPNVKFAVSFDTLDSDKFDRITRTKGYFRKVLDGIEVLADSGNLYRINMVVHQWNHQEVLPMIGFCSEMGCDIKLLEVCSVPIPYSNWEDFFMPFESLEEELARLATAVESHQYSRSFGIPMPIYHIGGVKVTVKASSHGARYDTSGICKKCEYFPCHEGLYDLYLIPDGRLCGCRWSETSVAKGETFLDHLIYLAEAFQRAEWLERGEMKPMVPMPRFVQHTRQRNE